MDVKYINPFITSVSNVFETMLDCSIQRTGVTLKDNTAPTHEVTGVIGLSGRARGSVVFSLSRDVAFMVVERMLGDAVSEINSEVTDAVGELTNIIAGGAKAELSQHKLSLGLPTVVVGRHHSICFPGEVQPLCIAFQTDAGSLCLEVGFDVEADSAGETAEEASAEESTAGV